MHTTEWALHHNSAPLLNFSISHWKTILVDHCSIYCTLNLTNWCFVFFFIPFISTCQSPGHDPCSGQADKGEAQTVIRDCERAHHERSAMFGHRERAADRTVWRRTEPLRAQDRKGTSPVRKHPLNVMKCSHRYFNNVIFLEWNGFWYNNIFWHFPNTLFVRINFSSFQIH